MKIPQVFTLIQYKSDNRKAKYDNGSQKKK